MKKGEVKYPRLTYKQLLDDAVRAAQTPGGIGALWVEIERLRGAIILLADYAQMHIGTNAAKHVAESCLPLANAAHKAKERQRGKK